MLNSELDLRQYQQALINQIIYTERAVQLELSPAEKQTSQNNFFKLLVLAKYDEQTNLSIIKGLCDLEINQSTLFADINPENLKELRLGLFAGAIVKEGALANRKDSLLNKIKKSTSFIIADANDLRREFSYLSNHSGNKQEIEEVVKAYDFLNTGHFENGIRKELFRSNSFDVVVAALPHPTLCNYENSIPEIVRVLKNKGVAILDLAQTKTSKHNNNSEYISTVIAQLKTFPGKLENIGTVKEDYSYSPFNYYELDSPRTRTLIKYTK